MPLHVGIWSHMLPCVPVRHVRVKLDMGSPPMEASLGCWHEHGLCTISLYLRATK